MATKDDFDYRLLLPSDSHQARGFTPRPQLPPNTFHGLRWFRRLVSKSKSKHPDSALLTHYTEEEVRSSLVVYFTPEDEAHFYYPFQTVADFDLYQHKFAPEERCFHEVIQWQQKPHFDLDLGQVDESEEELNFKGQLLLESLLGALLSTFSEECRIELCLPVDILVFSSHGKNKNEVTKCSYHVIIPNYYCEDTTEYQVLYDMVTSRMSSTFRSYVDPATRSSRHNLRILGSTKPEEERYKVWEPTFTFHGKEYRSIGDEDTILSRSLVTHVEGAEHISALRTLASVLKKKKRNDVTLNTEEAQGAVALLRRHYSEDALIVREVEGSYIILDRVSPYDCVVCRKSHENENPYLTINDGDVIFWCRRARRGVSIGSLDGVDASTEGEFLLADNEQGTFLIEMDDDSPPPLQEKAQIHSLIDPQRAIPVKPASLTSLLSLSSKGKGESRARGVRDLPLTAFSSQLH